MQGDVEERDLGGDARRKGIWGAKRIAEGGDAGRRRIWAAMPGGEGLGEDVRERQHGEKKGEMAQRLPGAGAPSG